MVRPDWDNDPLAVVAEFACLARESFGSSQVRYIELGQRQVDAVVSLFPHAPRFLRDGKPNLPIELWGCPVRVVEHPDRIAVVYRDGLEDDDVPRRELV